ncbi:MAG: Dihydropteroate synthase [Brockia lithotrophica]|uniref:Dihydropteroate synthase n=1 Tax=Brockia lithotrophica TaxID=933949 RepID=A0A2T5G563_9BACL|nr:dihydropteroate synthase [Brockia lithotrophica]PTQ51295.1 MAG: Dihydropteroate synthase [Brockia lithotrophica]
MAKQTPRVRRLPPLPPERLRAYLRATGADATGVALMAPKGEVVLFWIERLSLKAANLLKQEALAAGGDLAVHRGVAALRVETTDALLLLPRKRLSPFLRKLKSQPFGLAELARLLAEAVRAPRRQEIPLPHGASPLVVGERPLVMGILNVTPDSFSDGGRFFSPESAVRRAWEIAEEGADLLDVGAESTRPGATPVAPEEQWRRLEPVLCALRNYPLPISVDTRSAAVAERALACGAHMINDVSALADDAAMLPLVVRSGVPVVLMHRLDFAEEERRENPLSMRAVIADLAAVIERLLEAGGRREQVIVDPGFGFGKTTADNLVLLRDLEELVAWGYPVLVGASRKRFLGAITGASVAERLEASLAAAVLAAARGAHILRVHDVAATRRALQVVAAAAYPEAWLSSR